MKRTLPLLSAIAALVLPARADEAAAATPSAAAPKVPAVALERNGFYETRIKDRLSLGLGISYSVLTDPTRPKDVDRKKTFVGFVWKLEDVDQVGVFPELRYLATDHLRLTLSMDRISGRTRNFNLEKHSDGNAELMGPELLVEGLLPLCDDKLVLHAGGGIVYDFADFEEVKWWNLGYSSYHAWVEYGSPQIHTAKNYYREIHVDDTFGWALAAGATWRPHPRFELDLSLRHVWIEPDCQFGYNYGKKKGFEKHSDGDFTLDHLAVALVGSYVF